MYTYNCVYFEVIICPTVTVTVTVIVIVIVTVTVTVIVKVTVMVTVMVTVTVIYVNSINFYCVILTHIYYTLLIVTVNIS